MKKKRVVHQKAKGPIDPKMGEIVRTIREKRKMTQAQLAQPDFSKGFISLLETGRTRASMRALGILARKLGVTPATLVGEDPGYGRLAEKLRTADKLLGQMERFTREHRPLVQEALAKYDMWASGQKDLAAKV